MSFSDKIGDAAADVVLNRSGLMPSGNVTERSPFAALMAGPGASLDVEKALMAREIELLSEKVAERKTNEGWAKVPFFCLSAGVGFAIGCVFAAWLKRK